MVHSGDIGSGRQVRRWRSVAEKRQIVQLTMESGSSVAEIARAHGVNANQVFKWRRALERGELIESYSTSALLPVTVSTPSQSESEVLEQQRETSGSSAGAIHIELPGRALISVESGAEGSLVRAVLESLRQ
jgi:transposase